ncbi:MAG TPA: phage head closure protein [Epulopiscium sp.]|nr:phage head closure protein [Candidatus Epulonipiscium sp.]
MIGELRHRISIQRSIVSKDNIGCEIETLDDIGKVWASIEPISNKGYSKVKQSPTDMSTKITIRYRNDITPMMVVIFGVRLFRIQKVINLEERCVFLELLCSEETDVKEQERDE